MIDLDAAVIKRVLDAFPGCLDPRAKQVIEMRYGINGDSPKTLRQIGDLFGVCRERVRQIERKALRKLKHPSKLRMVLPDCGKIDKKRGSGE
jgi:RNA polymerase primary sigma factor